MRTLNPLLVTVLSLTVYAASITVMWVILASYCLYNAILVGCTILLIKWAVHGMEV